MEHLTDRAHFPPSPVRPSFTLDPFGDRIVEEVAQIIAEEIDPLKKVYSPRTKRRYIDSLKPKK